LVTSKDVEGQQPSPAWDPVELEGALRLDPAGPDRYVNPRIGLNMSGNLFGGQFIANTLSAAMLSCGKRVPKSIQGVFLRPGRAGQTLELIVDRVQDGLRLSHRRVQMIQSGRLIFSAQVYLNDPQPLSPPEHQATARDLFPEPEALADIEELSAAFGDRVPAPIRQRLLSKKSVLVKPVRGVEGLLSRSPEPRLATWLKPTVAVPADPLFQYAALAFLSDYWLCWPTRSPHIESLFDPSNRMHSLDHSLWFHAPPDVKDWLLYEVESPIAGNGFGLGRGALYDRGGRLIASAAQQALLE
jgi:acyl-CoA thioesterase-2